MVLDSSLYDLSYHSYVCQSTANIVKISPKLRFLDDHNSKNTRLMWLKFGVAKLLCICIDLTKFEENPEGLSFFCVDLTWNDPKRHQKKNGRSIQISLCKHSGMLFS